MLPLLLLASSLTGNPTELPTELSAEPRRNRAPIALIGGFTTWGREELLGFHYWGGSKGDIQEDLRKHGFDAVTAAVGPLSSNWDRACEAYAILRGGRVDYGKAHALQHGHARYGRSYPGLLKDWGERDPATGGPRRVHLLGHSQGGQTARVLVQLLEKGDPSERDATPPEDLNPLFQGGHPWVFSVTTISTPHDGTSLVFQHEGLVGPVRKLLALGATSASPHHNTIYDVKLDQWGIHRQAGESIRAFSRRLLASPLWTGTRDFAAWDLGPDGARELNGWAKAQPGVFYFSWSTAKTREDAHGHHVPMPGMTALWRSGARYMGQALRASNGLVPVDASWWRNDGVVNTRSMAGPSTETVQSCSGTPRKGLWNHMGVLDGWDHSEIIGIGPKHGPEVLDFYRRWAAFLGSLED